MVNAVAVAASQMQPPATSMASAAEQTVRQPTAVMGATEQTSANVQSVSIATDELSSSIVEIDRQVSQSTGIGPRVVEDAPRSTQSVQNLAEVADGAVLAAPRRRAYRRADPIRPRRGCGGRRLATPKIGDAVRSR